MTETREQYETNDKPKPAGVLMLGFSHSTPIDVANRRFVARFGYAPEWVIRTGGAVLAGPVRED